MRGKTLVVIEAGNIGKEVINRAKSFGMKVLAYDSYEGEKAAKKLGYSYADLETLLSKSDVIFVNCPLNESTRHLLSSEGLQLLDEALLVNTARGAVVDSVDLMDAFRMKASVMPLDAVEKEWFDDHHLRLGKHLFHTT